ncbi:hypothetical protein V6Z11_D03G095800 [Gossypium hirsutum]
MFAYLLHLSTVRCRSFNVKSLKLVKRSKT